MALSDTFTALGNTIINLVNSRTVHKQNQLIAGDGIQIIENTSENNADICIHPDIEAAFQSVIDELNMEALGLPVILLEDIADESVIPPESPFVVSTNLTEIPDYLSSAAASPYYRLLYGNDYVTSISFDSLQSVGQYGLWFAFSNCTNLISVNLSSLQSIGVESMHSVFQNCGSLTSVNLSSLQSIGDAGLQSAFYGSTFLTSIDLSNVTSIGSSGLYGAFKDCASLTSLSFPALKSDSFGSYTNQFSYMLDGVTGCTVHFPSNLERVIGSWSDVTNVFAGTNTTVLFDLPATT